MKRTHTYISASSLALAGLLAAGSAHATGVSAGTLIENTATASYSSGSATGSVQSNTVTVKVDELLDVAVAGLTSTPAPTGSSASVLIYSVTNTGNGPEAFNITVNPTVTGNPYDAVVQSLVVDTNGNGVYDAGVDTVLASGASTPAIAADGILKLFVLVTLPSGAADGGTSQVRLTASAATGTGSPGAVFAGQGQGGGDAVVGTSGASSNALDSLIARLAGVSLTKSASIADPFGGAQPVPGAVVTYTLVATVSGSGDVEGLHITDTIPSGTSYQPGTLKLEGSAVSDAVDGDAGTGSVSGIDVSLGTLAGGSTKTVKFDVKIN